MNYLTNYYKNLAESLQDRVNALEQLLNEAGFEKAMRSKNPDQIKKEIARQKHRKEGVWQRIEKTEREKREALDDGGGGTKLALIKQKESDEYRDTSLKHDENLDKLSSKRDRLLGRVQQNWAPWARMYFYS